MKLEIDEKRQHMLDVVWKSMNLDRNRKHKFDDGTQVVFYKRLRISRYTLKNGTKVYDLVDTSFELYRDLPDSCVWYAYEEGLENLSDAIVKTAVEYRINNPSHGQTPETRQKMVELLKEVESIPNLNQIKSNYEQQQRENS